MRRSTGPLFASLILLGSGCAGFGVPKASLAKRGVSRLALTLNTSGVCPGHRARLSVVAITRGGERFLTQDKPGGTASWGNFDVSMRGGVVSPGGEIQLAGDPRRTHRRPAEVEVRLIHNPRVRASLKVPVRYDCHYKAWFRGRTGRPGRSASPSRTKALAGGRGAAGHTIRVWVDMVPHGDGPALIRVRMRSQDGRRGGLFYTSPGGSVLIDVSGGRGGRGGNGRVGAPGGRGGDGGHVQVTLAPAANKYRSILRVVARGGPVCP